MEAILKLQETLIKDYYRNFILSIYEREVDLSSYFSEINIYRGEEYIEKDIEILKKEIKQIIDDLKPIYLKAVSEVLVKLSNLPNHNFYPYHKTIKLNLFWTIYRTGNNHFFQ